MSHFELDRTHFTLSQKLIESLPAILTLEGVTPAPRSKKMLFPFHIHFWDTIAENTPSSMAVKVRKLLARLDATDETLVELIPIVEDVILRRAHSVPTPGTPRLGSKRDSKTPATPTPNGTKAEYAQFVGQGGDSAAQAKGLGRQADDLGLLVDFIGAYLGRPRKSTVEKETVLDDDLGTEAFLSEIETECETESDIPDQDTASVRQATDEETIEYYCRKMVRLLRKYSKQLHERDLSQFGLWDLGEFYVLAVLTIKFIQLYGITKGKAKRPELLAAFLEFVEEVPGVFYAKPADKPIFPPDANKDAEVFIAALLLSGFFFSHLINAIGDLLDFDDEEDDIDAEVRYWSKRTWVMVGRSVWMSGIGRDDKIWRRIIAQVEKLASELPALEDVKQTSWKEYVESIAAFNVRCRQQLKSKVPGTDGERVLFGPEDLIWHNLYHACMVDRGSDRTKIRLCNFTTESPDKIIAPKYAPIRSFA